MRRSKPSKTRGYRSVGRVPGNIEPLESRVLLSTTWQVTSTADSTTQVFPGMLRYAVNAAQSGDVIQFNSNFFQSGQVIQLVADQPLVLQHDVTINGLGPNVVSVQGTSNSSNKGEIFVVNSGATVTINGLGIIKGFEYSANAGGIDNEGTLTLNNCAVTGAYSPLNGGGIFNNGDLTLNNCTVSQNTAHNGAAIYSQAGSVTVNSSTFANNRSMGGDGGAIYSAGSLLVTSTTFSNNSADSTTGTPASFGGAIWSAGSPANIYSSTFSGNSALNGYGGGIFSSGPRLNLVNSTFSGNSAGGQGNGGALYANGYVLGVNCTMVGNSANYGGAIDVGDGQAGDVTLYNSILAQNTASTQFGGNDIYETLDRDYLSLFGFNHPVGPSLSSNNLIDDADSAGGLSDGSNGNIIGHPAGLGPLASNGGPTQTFSPQTGSLAIDAGSNDLAQDYSTSTPTPLTIDQRGFARIYNGTVDIGALEVQPPPVPASLTAVAGADEVDLSWASTGTPGTTYTLYRGTSPNGESTTPLATNISSTTYADTAVTAGVTYYYKVTAANAVLASGASPEASAIPYLPILNAATSADTITLTTDADNIHLDYSAGTTTGRMLIKDPLGLTINGDANNDTIVLNQTRYSAMALPNILHLNGTFTLQNLWATNNFNPLSGHSIDLGLSTLYVDLPGPTDFSFLTPQAVLQYVQNGYNGGAWNGQPTSSAGVITTAAAAQGYAVGSALYGDGTGADTVPNTVEVRTTVYGDANLDGTANLTDFLIVSRDFGKTNMGWDQGDFNYDDSVNLSDLLALTRHFGASVPPPPIVLAPTALSAAADPVSGPLAVHRRR